MGLIAVVLLLVAALLLVQAVAFAGSFWACGKMLGIPGVRFWPTLAIWLLLFVAILLPIRILALWVNTRDVHSTSFVDWSALALQVGVAWYAFHRMFVTSAKKSFSATLISLVAAGAIAWGGGFAIRARWLEWFHVPTGGLATTILGVHADIICDNCGFCYPISMSDYYDAQGRPTRFMGTERLRKMAVCPICSHEQEFQVVAPAEKGDRIVCDKLASPQRWDFVVFWYPPSGSQLPRGLAPSERVQYVKRLVGLPGETVRLAGGDVYLNGQRLQKLPGEVEDLWFLVHDAQYISRHTDEPAWKPASNSRWRCEQGTWTVRDAADARDELVFSRPISDFQAYNVRSNSPIEGVLPDVHALGDVKLICKISEYSGDGGFGFRWRYQTQEVTAHVGASGETTLEGIGGTTLHEDELPPAPPKPLSAGQTWEFAYRDGRIYVRQDRKLVASRLVGSQLWQDASHDVTERSLDIKDAADEASCRVSLFAPQCSLALSSLRLYRDVYYIADLGSTGRDDPNREYRLGPGEYFMLGDNSGRSSDSRFWGAVHDEDLVGVVRCIYWPPSRWRAF